MRGAQILAALLPADRCDEFLADMAEEFAVLREARGLVAARRWYFGQLFRSIRPVAARWLARDIARKGLAIAPHGVGAAFFAFAVLWLVAVAWVAPFSGAVANGHPASADWRPAGVMLEQGRVLPIYAFGGDDAIAAIGTTTLMRFSILALAPPVVAAITLLISLSLVDMRRSRHMSEPRNALGLKT